MMVRFLATGLCLHRYNHVIGSHSHVVLANPAVHLVMLNLANFSKVAK